MTLAELVDSIEQHMDLSPPRAAYRPLIAGSSVAQRQIKQAAQPRKPLLWRQALEERAAARDLPMQRTKASRD